MKLGMLAWIADKACGVGRLPAYLFSQLGITQLPAAYSWDLLAQACSLCQVCLFEQAISAASCSADSGGGTT